MYKIFVANSKTKKRLDFYFHERNSLLEKLKLLKQNPRSATGAHPLKGRLKGKWSCWIGSNIRIVYSIDETNKKIIIEAVGSHKIY